VLACSSLLFGQLVLFLRMLAQISCGYFSRPIMRPYLAEFVQGSFKHLAKHTRLINVAVCSAYHTSWFQVRAVEQRAAIEAAYADAEACARAAMERCKELQHMLSSAATEQERASAARAAAAAEAEIKSTQARACEAQAVDSRRAQDCAFAERRTLETQGYRQPHFVESSLGQRGGYLLD